MSSPAYESYKDSGVEWLGQVPSHWDVRRLKNELHETDTRAGDSKLELLGLSKSAGIVPRSSLTQGASESDNYGKYKEVRPGELVMNKMQAWNGVFGLSKFHGMVSPDYSVFAVERKGYARFICEALRTDMAAGEMFTRCRGMGIAFLRLNTPDFLNVKLAFPPEDEAAAIAAFLDQETGKIDALIEAQTRLIELLKEKRQAVISHAVTKGLNPDAPMKDSGIEWLGQVPAHWEVTRLANLFQEVVQAGDDSLPVLSVSIHDGVSDGEIDPDMSDRKITRSEDRTKYKRVAPNDLVYNMMRAWQGGFGTVSNLGAVSPAYVVARPHRPEVSKFIELLLRTPKAVEEMRRRSRGITDFRLRLYWDEFKDMYVIVPPSEEIQALLNAAADRQMQWDRLANNAEDAIGLLQERRAALISAAVTGKIDVRRLPNNQVAA